MLAPYPSHSAPAAPYSLSLALPPPNPPHSTQPTYPTQSHPTQPLPPPNPQALARAGMSQDDVDFWELNQVGSGRWAAGGG